MKSSHNFRACPHCTGGKEQPRLEVIRYEALEPKRKSPPLLFIHGGWHGAKCWDENFLPYFAGLGYECHALSLRGHGKSEGVEQIKFHTVLDYCSDLCRVASELATPPIIIAHSFGGFITTHYMFHHKPAAVILLAPVPPTGLLSVSIRLFKSHPLLFLKSLFTWNCRHVMGTPAIAKEMLFSSTMDDEKIQKIFSHLGSESFFAFLDGLLLRLPKKPKVECDVMVVSAEHDRLIGLEDNRTSASFFSGQLIEMKDIAHDVMLDTNWQMVAEMLAKHLQHLETKELKKEKPEKSVS